MSSSCSALSEDYSSATGSTKISSEENADSAAFFTHMYYQEYEIFGPYWGAESVPVDGANAPNILHFTQMVWKDTYSVGCAVSECTSNTQLLTFCNYRSRGNYYRLLHCQSYPLTTFQVTLPASTVTRSPPSSAARTPRSAQRSTRMPLTVAALLTLSSACNLLNLRRRIGIEWVVGDVCRCLPSFVRFGRVLVQKSLEEGKRCYSTKFLFMYIIKGSAGICLQRLTSSRGQLVRQLLPRNLSNAYMEWRT